MRSDTVRSPRESSARMRSRLDSAAAFNVSTIASSVTCAWDSSTVQKDINISLCEFRTDATADVAGGQENAAA